MWLKYFIPALIFFALPASNYAQSLLYIDSGVDTADTDTRESLRFIEKYFSEFNGDSLADFKKYWKPEDCAAHPIPDPLVHALGEVVTYSLGYRKTAFYVRPGEKYTHIKVHYTYVDTSGNVSLACITNHYVQFDANRSPHFINQLEVNSKDWKTATVRNIKYIYPASHLFSRVKADSLILKIKSLEKEWGLPYVTFRYYMADQMEELQKLRGFDYSLDMGNRDKPSGMSDFIDSAVYCGGLGENYFHEVVHLYLNPKFPGSPIKEGLAVFYGGSMGHTLQWHLARMKSYLDNHPEIDLNKLDSFWHMDNYTNPSSVIQGLLCQLAFTKDGHKGLERIMSYTTITEVLEKEFNTATGEWSTFLRKEINKY